MAIRKRTLRAKHKSYAVLGSSSDVEIPKDRAASACAFSRISSTIEEIPSPKEAAPSLGETPKAATKRALLAGLRNGGLEKAVAKMEVDMAEPGALLPAAARVALPSTSTIASCQESSDEDSSDDEEPPPFYFPAEQSKTLPAGWETARSRHTGELYYVNSVTGVSQFEFPERPVLQPAATETPKAATKRALLTGLRNGNLERAVGKMEEDTAVEEGKEAAATETPKAATKRALLAGLRNGNLERAVGKMEADTAVEEEKEAAASAAAAATLAATVAEEVAFVQEPEQEPAATETPKAATKRALLTGLRNGNIIFEALILTLESAVGKMEADTAVVEEEDAAASALKTVPELREEMALRDQAVSLTFPSDHHLTCISPNMCVTIVVQYQMGSCSLSLSLS